MGGYFIGLVSESVEARRQFRARIEAFPRGRSEAVEVDALGPLLVASRGLERRRAEGGDGLVLGPAFARDEAAGTDRGPITNDASPTSPAARFLRNFWGGYVAAFASSDGLEICRAPLGALPCYVRRLGGDLLIASGPRWLQRFAGQRARIDRAALARHLGFAHLRLPETCLADLEELPGGQGLTIAGGLVRQHELWSPWAWTRPAREIGHPEDAAAALLATTRACVAAQARSATGVLLKLSGGLDSSIVAACLAHAGVPFRTLTLVTDDATGDEREYARMVARHFGVDLVERRRDPARIDLSSPPARDLARPSIPLFRQESERLAGAEARAAGLSLLMDGGGGDNVFCSLQSASPVADCLRTPRGWRHIAATASAVAEIAHVGMPEVLSAAVARALRPQRGGWPAQIAFLSAEARADLPSQPGHPWLRAPKSTPPGRAAHVRLIAAAQSYIEGLDPAGDPFLAVPPLAQPLVELCLGMPSWLWFDRGLNRAIARRAFAGELPAAIVERRSKGTPDAFVAQLFEGQRVRIREELLGGALVDLGLLDAGALARVLAGTGPLAAGHLQRVMTLYDAELWCRGWLS